MLSTLRLGDIWFTIELWFLIGHNDNPGYEAVRSDCRYKELLIAPSCLLFAIPILLVSNILTHAAKVDLGVIIRLASL